MGTNKGKKAFEDIKHADEDNVEFWFARELQEVLEYKEWRNFQKVIDTAIIACNISQHEVKEHFIEISKVVEMPTGEQFDLRGFVEVNKSPKSRKIKDYKLTRYACYLIVMNGDPRKKLELLCQKSYQRLQKTLNN